MTVDYQLRSNTLEAVYTSQKEMAKSIGCSTRTIRRWKTGKFNPSQKYRNKLNRRWHYYKKNRAIQRSTKVMVTMKDGSKKIMFHRSELTSLPQVSKMLQEHNLSTGKFVDSLRRHDDISSVKVLDMSLRSIKLGS